jgi:hypothetical protein
MDWALTGGSWLAIVSLNAAVAAALGRSRLLWFGVSLVIGPLASLLLAVFGRSEALELAHQRAERELDRVRAADSR